MNKTQKKKPWSEYITLFSKAQNAFSENINEFTKEKLEESKVVQISWTGSPDYGMAQKFTLKM